MIGVVTVTQMAMSTSCNTGRDCSAEKAIIEAISTQPSPSAVFLDGASARHHKVPLPLSEQAVVGPGFYVKPLLPVLAADGAFIVLTITAARVRLFEASRFAMAEDEGADLPGDLGEVMGESDYENPLQAGPANRPNVPGPVVTKAQVYGDTPDEWRKGRLVEFIRRVAAALQAHLASDPVPVGTGG